MTHDYHWTFGKTCRISFPGGGDPVVEPPHAFSSDEGCATYSDASGQLLFYTDGQGLYDGADAPVAVPPLGGSQSSAHSAIIVPPAGGGSLYHIFAVHDVTAQGPVMYTAVSAAGGITAAPPTPVSFGPKRATERLAATSHSDCNKYWVISLENDGAAPGPGRIFSMLVDSDAGPSASSPPPAPFPFPTVHAAYTCKFSPDGRLFAVTSITSVEILNFDRSTGAFTAHSRITGATDNDVLYGVEFSPNGKYLYLSGILSGEVRRHAIGAPTMTPIPYSATDLVGTSIDIPHGKYRLGALQLGPNGKIYGAKVWGNTLLEIGDPDNLSASAVQFNVDAAQAGGGILTLPGQVVLGLPTFTRIADDCLGDRCARLAAEVNEQLAATPKVNTLRPCDERQPIEKPPCAPIDLPRIAPWTSIRWGDSKCDCIEGDDTEVMHLTVCNPYRNLTLSNLTIQQLLVVDMNGNPPPLLPDGSPSVQLVPVGPYCFDDLAPCTCVTRQFVLRLRGAVPGPYQILLRGICFDACIHGDEEGCFVFDVCKD